MRFICFRRPQLHRVFVFIVLLYSKLTHALSSINSPTSLDRRLLVLLDRDGVINVDVGPPGVLSSSQLKLTPNAANAIGSLKRNGHIVTVITNQSCVGKGLISSEILDGIHSHLQTMLLNEDKDAKIDSFYSCTSPSTMYDLRRKPHPGMIHEALLQYRGRTKSELYDDLTLYRERCVLIGDSWRDLEAATACGIIRRILVSTGYGLECMGYRKPSPDSILKVVAPLSYNTHDSLDSMETICIQPNEKSDKVSPFYYTENLSSAVAWLLGSI